jgi:hypothetical protein
MITTAKSWSLSTFLAVSMSLTVAVTAASAEGAAAACAGDHAQAKTTKATKATTKSASTTQPERVTKEEAPKATDKSHPAEPTASGAKVFPPGAVTGPAVVARQGRKHF